MKVFINPKKNGNAIVSIASGGNFLRNWDKVARNGWEDYCKRHELGLIVFDTDLVSKNDENWKKAHWQKMLIGTRIQKEFPAISSVCYLDTDIIIGPYAPNVFAYHDKHKIGVTSLRNNLPYPYDLVLRRIAYLRNRFYDSRYPLDSSMFISTENLYKHHGLEPQTDEACTGLILFNIEEHAQIMSDWYYKYDSNTESITNGGEQTHLNYEIQRTGQVQWLDYKFQALWAFEMAWKYPFLYECSMENDEKLIRSCIEASLCSNHFLHFAGSWNESAMFNVGGFFKDKQNEIESYNDYLAKPVYGMPVGMVKPDLNRKTNL